MNKNTIKNFINDATKMVSKRSPEILTGIGIAGMVTTTVLAVKATPKALILLEDAEKEKGDELTPVEKVKAAWKPYIPTVITGTVSIACLVGASSVNARRNAALYSAYKLSETALSDYKEKVIETIGEKKEQVVKEKVAKEKVDQNPVSKNEVIVTAKGETLCYDAISGRYFKSDLEKIRQVVNDLNKRILVENYISLTEFYSELGLSKTTISDELGWSLNNNGLIELDFSTQMSDDGRPCIVVDYLVAPRYDFQSLY